MSYCPPRLASLGNIVPMCSLANQPVQTKPCQWYQIWRVVLLRWMTLISSALSPLSIWRRCGNDLAQRHVQPRSPLFVKKCICHQVKPQRFCHFSNDRVYFLIICLFHTITCHVLRWENMIFSWELRILENSACCLRVRCVSRQVLAFNANVLRTES